MKRLFIFIFVAITCFSISCDAYAAPNAKTSKQLESLKYDVYYHWGIIWKKAGTGILTFADETGIDGKQRYHGKLTARTSSFIEYLMAVRDTLDCYFTPNYIPLEFSKKTHEGSYQAIERNYYTSFPGDYNLKAEQVDSTRVEIKRWRNKKGNDSKSFSNKGVAYDMLSIFYIIRRLDFENMKVGEKFKFPIFAGIRTQNMNVKYEGKSTCQLRSGKKYSAYKLLLTFNTKDEDSAPLYVWLSTESDHRPLSVTIQLKRIGSIQGEIVE